MNGLRSWLLGLLLGHNGRPWLCQRLAPALFDAVGLGGAIGEPRARPHAMENPSHPLQVLLAQSITVPHAHEVVVRVAVQFEYEDEASRPVRIGKSEVDAIATDAPLRESRDVAPVKLGQKVPFDRVEFHVFGPAHVARRGAGGFSIDARRNAASMRSWWSTFAVMTPRERSGFSTACSATSSTTRWISASTIPPVPGAAWLSTTPPGSRGAERSRHRGPGIRPPAQFRPGSTLGISSSRCEWAASTPRTHTPAPALLAAPD